MPDHYNDVPDEARMTLEVPAISSRKERLGVVLLFLKCGSGLLQKMDKMFRFSQDGGLDA